MYLPRILPLMIVALLLLAACGASAPAATPGGEGVEEENRAGDAPTERNEIASDESATAEEADMENESHGTASDAGEEMVAEEEMPMEVSPSEETTIDAAATTDRPAWQHIALTDARTGENFTLVDFAGKTVFVEPFATWCSNCRRQLGNVTQARAQLSDDVVFVALSVEPNIGNDVLARYAGNEGFDLIFAAMPPEMLQELAARFGQTVSNPPATPHFIIRSDGTVTELVTGIERADAIISQIQAEQR